MKPQPEQLPGPITATACESNVVEALTICSDLQWEAITSWLKRLDASLSFVLIEQGNLPLWLLLQYL